ncbi:Transmembrane and coiled-coil domain-containing protein 4, partial [Dipsacomyces acuminosporus]
MEASGGMDEGQLWNHLFTQSVLEWLQVPAADRPDIITLPFGEAANDVILHMLRTKRKDEEDVEAGIGQPSGSLVLVGDPDRLFAGLILTCLGINDHQLSLLEGGVGEAKSSGQQEKQLRPFEYDARSRATAFLVCGWLDMPKQFISTHEARVSLELERTADKVKLTSAGSTALEQEKKRKWGWKKYLVAGTGVAVAGTLVGVTAGLAAPLIAAGLGAVGVGGIGFLATASGAAMVGSLLGVAGGGLIGKRFNTRLRGLREFYFMQLPLDPHTNGASHSLHATILVPGFLDPASSTSPFAAVSDILGIDLGDAYTLYFETKELAALEGALSKFVNSTAKNAAITLAIQQTALHVLVGAFAWPLAILKIGQLIDTPWSVGLVRAKRAGKLLAEVLIQRAHGNRPVTLVGYSLGALAIFTCLQELHRGKAYGIVDSVVLLGMPADGADKDAWSKCCHCVARQVVIGFSRNDWLLAFLLRASSFCAHLAGLSGVDLDMFADQPLVRRKLTNLDLSELVENHSCYLSRLDDIFLE